MNTDKIKELKEKMDNGTISKEESLELIREMRVYMQEMKADLERIIEAK